jgi:glycosyltransferase 2 family protein
VDAAVRGVSRIGRTAGERGRGLSEPRRSGFERLGRKLLVPAALAVLALVGLALFADARELAARVAAFDPALLVPVLSLSLVNYGLRFARWQLYLAHLGSRLPVLASLGVFLVGFVLSVTPGKAGELGKAWLVRELGGGRALPVVSAVLAERATDLLGVVLLVAFGALAVPGGAWIAAAGVALVAAALLLLGWRRGAHALFARLARVPKVGHRVPALEETYDRLRQLLSPAMLAAGLALSVVAWGAEGVGFWLVVGDHAPGAGVVRAVFDYSASTLAGALSMVPGGLLATEGSLAALLDAQGLDNAAAASATLITRTATLWFAVALGLVALPIVLAQVRRRAR